VILGKEQTEGRGSGRGVGRVRGKFGGVCQQEFQEGIVRVTNENGRGDGVSEGGKSV